MDRSVLGAIGDSFFHARFTPEAILLLAAIAVLLVAAIAFGMLLNRWLSRSKPSPQGDWITEPGRIRECLEQTFDQRAKIELRFELSEGRSRFLNSTLVRIEDETLALELSEAVNIGRDWIGRSVEAFFKVRDEKSRTNHSFYAFDTEIVGLRKPSDDYVLVEVAEPRKLEKRQKRSHLRIDPPSEMVELTLHQASGSGGHVAGDPVLILDKSRSEKGRVVNISAGGLRLELTGRTALQPGRSISIGDRFALRLTLFEPGGRTAARHLLLAKVQGIFEDHSMRKKEVGLRFIGLGTGVPDHPQSAQWQKLGRDAGVEAIDNWVFKRHLEMYRDKGLA